MLGICGVISRTENVPVVREVAPGRSEIVDHRPETVREACIVVDADVPEIPGDKPGDPPKRPAGLVRVVVFRSDGMMSVHEVSEKAIEPTGP